MQDISNQVSFTDSWQSSEMHQLMLILYVFHELKELYFTRDEICNLCPNVLKLNVVTFTDEITLFQWPTCSAIFRLVLVLPSGYHKLESISLFIAELDAHFVSRLLKGLADGLSC